MRLHLILAVWSKSHVKKRLAKLKKKKHTHPRISKPSFQDFIIFREKKDTGNSFLTSTLPFLNSRLFDTKTEGKWKDYIPSERCPHQPKITPLLCTHWGVIKHSRGLQNICSFWQSRPRLFKTKLSSKNILFLKISNSHLFKIAAFSSILAYSRLKDRQNKVTCIKLEVKFMVFHDFLWL